MDNLEYIDGYFGEGLPPEDAIRFEKKIQEDPVFAEEVAYYLGALAALRTANAEDRKARFRELFRAEPAQQKDLTQEAQQGQPARETQQPQRARETPLQPRRFFLWRAAGAAAAILAVVVLAWLFVDRPANGPKLAERYIRQNLATLPLQMGAGVGAGDDIQRGVALYNAGRFSDAWEQFQDVLRADPANPTALLDAGLVSLRMENYDKAVDCFIQLQHHTDPRVSPGLFYEALTRLSRNRAGDSDVAKQELMRIVREDLSRKEDARELLRKM